MYTMYLLYKSIYCHKHSLVTYHIYIYITLHTAQKNIELKSHQAISVTVNCCIYTLSNQQNLQNVDSQPINAPLLHVSCNISIKVSLEV